MGDKLLLDAAPLLPEPPENFGESILVSPQQHLGLGFELSLKFILRRLLVALVSGHHSCLPQSPRGFYLTASHEMRNERCMRR